MTNRDKNRGREKEIDKQSQRKTDRRTLRAKVRRARPINQSKFEWSKSGSTVFTVFVNDPPLKKVCSEFH